MASVVFELSYSEKQDAAAVTSHSWTNYAQTLGDRNIFTVTVPSSTVTTPAGWNVLGPYGTSFPKTYIFWRDDLPTVTTTFAFTTAAAVMAVGHHFVKKAGGFKAGVAPVAAGVSGTSTTPDPPSLSIPWGVGTNIACIASFAATTMTASSTAPTGYADSGREQPSISGRPGCDIADRTYANSPASTENPAAWTALGASTAWTAITLAFQLEPRAPTRFSNAQTFYGPTISERVKPGSRFDNAQTFYAPTVVVAPSLITLTQTARLDNTQAFFAPSIKQTVVPSLATNAQAFYAPVVKARISTPLATNAQTFYAPKLSAKLTVTARFNNAQAFFAPKLNATVKLTARHTNAQVFYAPTVTVAGTKLTQTARLDNAQVFYAPRVTARLAIAARHNNAQGFFTPKIAATIKAPSLTTNVQAFYGPTITQVLRLSPIRHDNAQAFFAPKLAALYKVAARFDNAQVFYPPKIATTVRLTRFDNAQVFFAPKIAATVKAPSHVNAQQFFAPTIRRELRVQAPRHDNTSVFFLPTVTREQYVQPTRLDNAQTFYLPLAVNRVGAPIQAPPFVNAQQFYAPKIATRVKQTGGGAPGWDVTGGWTFDHELSGGHYFHTMTLAQDPAGNLSGSGFVSIYLYNVTSGTVVGNAIEFFATYYDPAVVVGVVLHVIGTIAPDGTISGTWTDTYGGGRAGAITTAPGGGAAVAVPGGAGFENHQTFYGPRVAPQAYVAPSRFDNTQTFYPPTLRLTVKATARFDNAQSFFAPSLHQELRVGPPRHTNTQVFYPPSIKTMVRAARHDNTQAFFGPKLATRVRILAPVVNAQAFFAPTLRATVRVSRFDNAQVFYPARLSARLKVATTHENAQAFFEPLSLRATYRVLARHNNAQAFLPTSVVVKLPNVVTPNLHLNHQVFYGPITITFDVPPVRDPTGALRIFEDARFEFNGIARLTEFTGSRLTEFNGTARLMEFGAERRTVFRSRLIEGTFVT